MTQTIAFFGVSNFLSDLFDCALANGHTPSRVIMNCEEAVRARTKSVCERVAVLPTPPAIVALDEFVPDPDEACFIGTTAATRNALVGLLRSRHALRFVSLIHPTAYVSPLACVSEGVFVGAGSVIAAGAILEEFALVNRQASVGHDTVVGCFARVQPGATVGGHVRIGAGATIGLGANVIEELVIGEGALVAAGATVITDVPPGGHVASWPARVRKPSV